MPVHIQLLISRWMFQYLSLSACSCNSEHDVETHRRVFFLLNCHTTGLQRQFPDSLLSQSFGICFPFPWGKEFLLFDTCVHRYKHTRWERSGKKHISLYKYNYRKWNWRVQGGKCLERRMTFTNTRTITVTISFNKKTLMVMQQKCRLQWAKKNLLFWAQPSFILYYRTWWLQHSL